MPKKQQEEMEEEEYYSSFKVETRGLKQQFQSIDAAKRKFNKLVKEAEQEEESISIKLLGRDDAGTWEVIEEFERTEY